MFAKDSKKGLSPIITTILLVLLAVVLAAIIFLWARGFVKEGLVKFGEPIERACDKIKIEAAINSGSLLITNRADVPIYKFKLVSSSAGSSSAQEIAQAINPGESKTISVTGASGSKLIPILLGNSKNNEIQEYECPKKYWFSIN
ncbi:hypothetical protein FJZ17_04480 [Candidatus Pacearchaeota archaeon]|nr:hypothetical protein [Candidatus Pacearchaeota archaeon]